MARAPRLLSLSIQDFRGFPGQGNPAIQIGGKNLLVYGENGAGKSTIFRALDSFFSIDPASKRARRKVLNDAGHLFTPEAQRSPSIEVTYSDGQTFRWDETGHPNDTPGNGRVFAAAYRKGMLDYRSLLDVSYRYHGSKIDLFPACVSVLLRDLQIAHAGGEQPLHRLWSDAVSGFKLPRHHQNVVDDLNARLASITAGLNAALPLIRDRTDELLQEMLHGELTLDSLDFTGLVFRWNSHKPSRKITGDRIVPSVSLRGEPIDRPHTFLNEARVSALAIALYLAGRKVCGETLQPDTPKMLVLDDLLVGLDQSNRLPVLKMLTRHFSRWQIILLTHDRVWFEMARAHLPAEGRNAWSALEMFEALEPSGATRPAQRALSGFDPITGNIARAKAFRADHYDNAAAVHARMAFEQTLKWFCNWKGVPVCFKSDPRHLTTDNLLTGLESWLKSQKWATQRVALAQPISDVKAARRVVLNQFSHSTPITIVAGEIDGAIAAVEGLYAVLRAQNWT